MPMPSATDRIRADHADDLFVLAQLASPDGRTAARHVAEVLATADIAAAADIEEERQLLVRALLERVETAGDETADAPSPLARAQLSRVVGERLPVVLSGLEHTDRVLLGMRFVQDLSSAQVAGQLGLEDADVSRREEHLTAEIRQALLSGAAPYELDALSAHLTTEELRRAIGHTLGSDLQALPPSLRSSPPPVQAQASPSKPAGMSRLLLAGYLTLALAVTLLTVYAVTRAQPSATGETDALTLAARQAASVDLLVETNESERAAQFARDHSGFSFVLPTLDGYQMRGVTLHELATGVSVPAFGLGDESGEEVIVFTFPYSLLDRAGGHLTLTSATRTALEAQDAVAIYPFGKTHALVWRHRDDVFVAVTDGDPDALSTRIVWERADG